MGFVKQSLCMLAAGYLASFSTASGQLKNAGNAPDICLLKSESKSFGWLRVKNQDRLKLPKYIGKRKLPLAYHVYTIDEQKLRQFLMTVKKDTSKFYEIAVPSPQLTCESYSLSNSGTMAPALAASFPELVSLKGVGTEDKNAALRLDYNGSELNVEVTRTGTIYFIAPWKKGKKMYYLVYRKEDAGIPKRQFEAK